MKIGNESFNVISKLGKGSFGSVYKVEKNGKFYALKIIENDVKNEGIKSLRELDIMGKLSHPNLTDSKMVVAEYQKESKIGILMDKADRDLYKAMYDKKFSTEERLKVLFQVTQGLDFLHDSGYLHLDLKPLNILMFPNNVAKITDFGLSLILEEKDKYYPVKLTTVDHRAINIIKGSRKYTKADDIWSLGLIFMQVLSNGRYLFSKFKKNDFTSENVRKVYEEKLNSEVIKDTMNYYLSNLKKPLRKKVVDIISRMLIFDPDFRASSKEVLSFFKKIKLNKEEKGIKINPPIVKPDCQVVNYEGFDILVRLSSRIPISLETFFLAADIYQRALSLRRHSDDSNQNNTYVIYTAVLALYMAVKMIETFFADTEKMISLSGNLFTSDKLIEGETVLVNEWKGIIYPENLFTFSSTLIRFNLAFDVLRNCFIYRKIDLKKWKEYNDTEEIIDKKYNKYSPFNDFLAQTSYYSLVINDQERNYIKELYEKDKM